MIYNPRRSLPIKIIMATAIISSLYSNLTDKQSTLSSSTTSTQVSPSASKTAEVETQIESVFLRYEQVNYVSSTLLFNGNTVYYMGITIEGTGSYWKNSINNIVSELYNIEPSASIMIFDKDVNLLYDG